MYDIQSFQKESAKAKSILSLEELHTFRAKTAARLVLVRESGVFSQEDISRVEASVADYDRRIVRKERMLARQAQRTIRKEAMDIGLV